MKALLAFLAGVACALTLTSHKPRRQWIGWRCQACGCPGATEGELLGLDDRVRMNM